MKILIHADNLKINGMVKSLINFATLLSVDNEVDIVLFEKTGDLFETVPKNISIFECGDVSSFYRGQAVLAGQGKIGRIKGIIKKILISLGVRNIWYDLRYKKMKQNINKLKRLNGYDVAICFDAQGLFNLEYVLKCVDAETKLCLFHQDIYNTCVNKEMVECFKQYDKILGVSKSCAKKIQDKYPFLENIDYLYNCQDVKTIIEKSKEEMDIAFDKDKLNIVSVARLDKQKNMGRFVKVLKALNNNNGYNYNCYIIGDGYEREKIQKYIEKRKLSNVFLLGSKANPYKYIKECDLFVLPSMFEACPMVYAEAMTLGVPVLSTDTCSAHEILDDWGFICENSEKGIYSSLKGLLENPSKIDKKKEKIEQEYQFSNEEIIQRFYNLVKRSKK